jgi:hypothetical protein
VNLAELIFPPAIGAVIAAAGYVVGRDLTRRDVRQKTRPIPGLSWSKFEGQGPDHMTWRPISEAPSDTVLVLAAPGRPGGQNFTWPPEVRFGFVKLLPAGLALMPNYPESGRVFMNYHTGQPLDITPRFFVVLSDLPIPAAADAPVAPTKAEGPPL